MYTLDDIRISNSESSTSSTPKSQNQNISSHRGYDELLAECRLNRAPQSPLEREYLLDETRQVAQRYLADIGTVESREQLLKILHSQHSLLSPIRKLPPEIVTEIFCFIVAENPLEFGTTPHYQLKPRVRDADVLTLTWVCFWWRSLALSRPSLWSLIDVRIQDHYWAPSERMTVSRGMSSEVDSSFWAPHTVESCCVSTLQL
ncbi:hypothetical protein BT96DRAFT_995213 [Gymnopus androsaceus JB14]|uniref:Uncharacterized protein n=1 Tax=Gymnopus androsaceus JB14 TaxID=1447944 RepID=A0A6A4HIW1_9AGAR|nr:hypothetical protein BT96DRAFT_995213 [Gymnopus androsaceus JB14]